MAQAGWFSMVMLVLLSLAVIDCDDDTADGDGDADGDTDGDTDGDSDGDPALVDMQGPPFNCEPTMDVMGAAYLFGGEDAGEYAIQLTWYDARAQWTIRMMVDLWTLLGAPTAAGTYPLTASEADYATCTICVRILTEDAYYMPVADSGSITITDITLNDDVVGSFFAFSLDADFQEVTIDDTTLATTPVAGGCVAPITWAASGTVEPYPEYM